MTEKILIRDLTAENKPRERLLDKGAEALSDAELLAIVLRTGDRNLSALDVANNLLKNFGSLKELCNSSPKQLLKTKGIGQAKATAISAVYEIAKRIFANSTKKETYIKTPKEAYYHIRRFLHGKKQEHLYLIALDSKRKVLKTELISMGGVQEALFPIRELVKRALENEAVSIIIAHNHPSQDPTPSSEDATATADARHACKLVGLNFLDHIIVTDNDFFSFKSTNF